MPIALGLDAGGTYTDAVLYDLDQGRLLASAKSPTTPPSYVEGVAGAIAALPEDVRRRASYVALSTTLATNAIVEGRHAPAGLVLIGYDAYEAREIRWEPRRVVPGRHSIRGVEIEPFDVVAFRRAVEELAAEGIAGLAISSVLSVRNPEHEVRAAAIAREMTDLPVVCGHEVVGVLNALVRAETAALNAGLIPLLHRFILAVEGALADIGLVRVPCFMVTGDGALMSAAAARLRPVETILSGPACSVFGAARLAGIADALVVDVGGTTTDIARLEGGRPRMAARGVAVGSWRAGVRSAEVLTRGLGGDSAIGIGPHFSVGPRRVVPISQVGLRSPALAKEFAALRDQLRKGRFPGGDWRLANPTEAFIRLTGVEPPSALDDQERAILAVLATGPLTRASLSAAIRYPHLSLLRTDRLERWGLVARAGLTPTDLWHVTGEYAPWHVDTARAAAEIASIRLGVSVDELVARVREETAQALVRQVVSAHMGLGSGREGLGEATLAGRIARIALGEEPSDGLCADITLRTPIIGVGAPARLFLEPVARRLDGRLVVPEGAPVANAVGAAIGAVIATRTALIRPQEDGSILCYGPEERCAFAERDAAVAWAREQLLPIVRAELACRGAVAATIDVHVEHRGTEVRDVADPIWWETHVLVRGVGQPATAETTKVDAALDADETSDTDEAVEPAESEPRVAVEWTPGLKEAEERRADG